MVGAPANFVFLAAVNAREALQLQPVNRLVVRNGNLISSRQERITHQPLNEDDTDDRK